jgi:hypothetical protein
MNLLNAWLRLKTSYRLGYLLVGALQNAPRNYAHVASDVRLCWHDDHRINLGLNRGVVLIERDK